MVKTDWIWRLDDDNIVEPDALQKLLEAAGDTNGGVGAVGGCIFHGQRSEPPKLAMTKIENTFFNAGNIQWYYGTKRMELDTLYSTFIYSVEAAKQIGGYCMELSPVGHREETIFTYELKRHGWKLIFEPKAVTWHLRENTGGIRSWKGEDNYRHDDEIFKRKLSEWGVKLNEYKFAVLDNGMGDHQMFKNILPEIREKNKDRKIVIGCHCPELFADCPNEIIVNMIEASLIGANSHIDLKQFDIYDFCMKNNWTGHMMDAYRKMYCE